jgi:cyclase
MPTNAALDASGLTPLGNAPAFEGGLQEVAERTWAWIQPNGDLGESNSGLIAGEGSSILVDTLWDERLTSRMLEAMEGALERAPIATLVNTHGDGDHWYGNGLVGEGVEIVATEAAAVQMADEPPSMLTKMRPLPRIAGLAARVPALPGRTRMRGLAGFGAMLGHYEFSGIEPRGPSRTFRGMATVEAGGRQADLVAVGPAHTSGDALVWLADERVCFSGDIVFNGVTPIMWAGPATNWIAALERLLLFEPKVIVPGHGPVCGPEAAEQLIAYWRFMLEAVPGALGDTTADRSAPALELAERIVLSGDFRAAPWGSWRGPERNLVNVALIIRERDGRSAPISTRERIALLAQMGVLRERLEAAGVA